MDFYGTKQNGRPVYPPAIAEQRRILWDKIKEGSTFKSSLSVPRESKTHSQVKAIWGMVIAMAVNEFSDRGWDTSYLLNLPEPTGCEIKGEILKLYLYEVCPIHDDNGRVTLSKMTTEQASKFFEDCRNFMASQWNIIIPDPRPDWKEK
jgi:hypothetical protein